jgi:hypothetical protein
MNGFLELDIPSLLVGAIVGAVVSVGYGLFLKRPLLEVSGGGGGGGPGPGHHSNYVNIRNKPGLFGIHLNPTMVFGWRVHRNINWGFVISREPATGCSATLYDKSRRSPVGLSWRRNDGSFSQIVDIESGQSVNLMLFARLDSEPLRYFIFRPVSETDGSPSIPPDDAKLTENNEFVVEVHYSYGRKKRFPVAVYKTFEGRLEYRTPGSGGSF